MLTAVRGQLVMLQGIWFIQIAEILFKGEGLAHSLLLCRKLLNITFKIKLVQDVLEEAACLPFTVSVSLSCSVGMNLCVSHVAYPCSLCVENVRHKSNLEPYEVTNSLLLV